MPGILDLFICFLLIIAPVSSLWMAKNIFSEQGGGKRTGILDKRKRFKRTRAGRSVPTPYPCWRLGGEAIVPRGSTRRCGAEGTMRGCWRMISRPMMGIVGKQVGDNREAAPGPPSGPTAGKSDTG
jgi:hypothetical protein